MKKPKYNLFNEAATIGGYVLSADLENDLSLLAVSDPLAAMDMGRYIARRNQEDLARVYCEALCVLAGIKNHLEASSVDQPTGDAG